MSLLKKNKLKKVIRTQSLVNPQSLIVDELEKDYSLTERTKLLEFLKFYSEWLYGPVDEDLENKMYFLEKERDDFVKFCDSKLYDTFNTIKEEDKLNFLYGVRFKI